jgi:hypothetical protein
MQTSQQASILTPQQNIFKLNSKQKFCDQEIREFKNQSWQDFFQKPSEFQAIYSAFAKFNPGRSC